MSEGVSALAKVLGYRYEADEIRQLKRERRSFYRKLRDIEEEVRVEITRKTPSNRVFFLRKNENTRLMEAEAFLYNKNVRVLEQIPTDAELHGYYDGALEDSLEKKLYWVVENNKLEIRHSPTLSASGKVLPMMNCIYLNHATGEAFTTMGEHKITKLKSAIGCDMICLSRRIRSKSPDYCLEANQKRINEWLSELITEYDKSPSSFPVVDVCEKKKKKKKSKRTQFGNLLELANKVEVMEIIDEEEEEEEERPKKKTKYSLIFMDELHKQNDPPVPLDVFVEEPSF